jgi:hypothetical protein
VSRSATKKSQPGKAQPGRKQKSTPIHPVFSNQAAVFLRGKFLDTSGDAESIASFFDRMLSFYFVLDILDR